LSLKFAIALYDPKTLANIPLKNVKKNISYGNIKVNGSSKNNKI